jgi:hypothetical protein
LGGAEIVEANNRLNAKHWRDRNDACLIKRDTPPVNVVGGYKFPGAPIVDLAPAPVRHPQPHGLQIPADLSIPDFLRRAPEGVL